MSLGTVTATKYQVPDMTDVPDATPKVKALVEQAVKYVNTAINSSTEICALYVTDLKEHMEWAAGNKPALASFFNSLIDIIKEQRRDISA
jgi:homoserine dehydrogenase